MSGGEWLRATQAGTVITMIMGFSEHLALIAGPVPQLIPTTRTGLRRHIAEGGLGG